MIPQELMLHEKERDLREASKKDQLNETLLWRLSLQI